MASTLPLIKKNKRFSFEKSARCFIAFYLFSFLPVGTIAQEKGFIDFKGFVQKKTGESLAGVVITVYKNTQHDKQIMTNKKGKFNVKLDYGYDYKLNFSYPGMVDMHLLVFGNIPEKKQVYIAGIDIPVVFFDTTDRSVTLSKYKHPFTKFVYDGKTGFTDDQQYLQEFAKGIFTEDEHELKARIAKEKAEREQWDAEEKAKKNFIISGRLLANGNSSKPVSNTKIKLVNDQGGVMQSTITNSYGRFIFTEVSPGQNFKVIVDAEASSVAINTPVTLTNKNGKKIMTTNVGEKGEFSFDFLAADKDKIGFMIVNDNNLIIAGNLLTGENPSRPIPNIKVNVVNELGNILETSTTNIFGSFVFKNLPPDQTFLITVEDSDTKLSTNVKISITNKNGKEIMTTTADAKGNFEFKFLAVDKNLVALMSIDDTELSMNLKGKLLVNREQASNPLGNAKVSLLDGMGKVVQVVITDVLGVFKFEALSADQNYSIQLEGTDSKLAAIDKVLLADENGKVLQEIKVGAGSTFRFELLPPDQKVLSSFYVDDPWLDLVRLEKKVIQNYLISENVYFNVNDWAILPEAKKILDKVILIMQINGKMTVEISSHTDAQGSDEYNINLSKKRAKMAMDYVLARGIAASRLSGKGYGETKLINNCSNGVKCSEEDHAKNRRLEFKMLVN